jgi:hypothetical protein
MRRHGQLGAGHAWQAHDKQPCAAAHCLLASSPCCTVRTYRERQRRQLDLPSYHSRARERRHQQKRTWGHTMGDRTTWHHLVVWPGVQRRSSSSAHSPVATLLSTYAGSPAVRLRPAHRGDSPRRRLRNARARPNRPPDSRLFARARGTIILPPIVLPAVTSMATGRPPDSAESTGPHQLDRSSVAGLDRGCSGAHRFTAAASPSVGPRARTMACPLPPWPGPASQMLRFATCWLLLRLWTSPALHER